MGCLSLRYKREIKNGELMTFERKWLWAFRINWGLGWSKIKEGTREENVVWKLLEMNHFNNELLESN